jgi:O-antigen ligase
VKWVGLAITLTAALALSVWLRRHNSRAPKVWVLVGLLPSLLTVRLPGVDQFAHLTMAFTSVTDLLAHYTHGAEFSVLDGLALALYFSLPARRDSLPFRLAMSLYFVAVVLSTFQSPYPMATLFYVWQLARMFLIYAVVARGAAADPGIVPAILTGMAIGLFLQVPAVLWQRIVLHLSQASGTYDAQNILGLNSHFIVFPMFALFLTRHGGWFSFLVVLAGLSVELLTASRATIGIAAASYAGLFMLSALRQWTSRKALIAASGIAVAVLLVPVALLLVQQRGAGSVVSSDVERDAFQEAARAMILRHPFGVGANNYVIVANVEGFNAAAHVPFDGWHGIVHNVYLLVGAETGIFGLIAFLLVLVQPMIVGFLCSWRNRKDPRGDLLLGLSVALLTVAIHSLFEWVLISDLSQYPLAMEIGMVAGLAKQLGFWRQVHPLNIRSRVIASSRRPLKGYGTPRRAV